MKTDDLVSMLATGVEPADPHSAEKRFALALVLGLSGAGILMETLLGVRPDLARVALTWMFWLKLAFPVSVLCAMLSVTARLARPGRTGGPGGKVLVVIFVALWTGAIATFTNAPPAMRPHMVFGDTWRVCTMLVALLSIPAFCAAFWALRGLAPTRLQLAGAAAGLMAGAEGLLVYSLHCPESALPFWAIWYVLGMLVPALLGAAVGKTLLRW